LQDLYNQWSQTTVVTCIRVVDSSWYWHNT